MQSQTVKPVVIYDGDCAFCRRHVADFQRRDAKQEFEYIPRQAPGLENRFPILKSEDFDSGMRLIEPGGRLFRGADALYQVFRRLPYWRRIAWLYRVPGVGSLVRLGYSWIAANRHRLGQSCDAGPCDLRSRGAK